MRLALALLVVLALTPTSAWATDFIVENSADAGEGSLRDRVADAGSNDRVVIPQERGTITLTSGAITIAKNLTIEGAGRASTSVSGNDNGRVFSITDGSVTLRALTVRDGAIAPADYLGGGCVVIATPSSANTLTLDGVAVRDCSVTGAVADGGGGVFADGENLTITDSVLTGNTYESTDPDPFVAGGGAIFSNGGDQVRITSSELSGNSAEIDSLSPDNTGGGAIYTNGGDILALQSTILRDNELRVTADPASTSGDGHGGGAIHSVSSLTTLVDSAVDENTATITVHEPFSDGGGGLYTNGGDLSMTDSSVSANTATVSKLAGGTESDTSGGGGVYLNGGDIAMADSTVADNTAVLTVGAADNDGGAGVYSNGGGFAVEGSTFSGNALTLNVTAGASQSGGGGYFGYTRPGSSMVNSTFSQNSAQINGGGTQMGGGAVFLWAVLEPAQFTNVTIAQNSTNRSGGGLYNMLPPLKNTLLAGNTGGNCAWGEPEEDVSLGHNLSSDGTCDLDAAGDKSGVDPKLKPLADNGGITLTHDLNDGSPALDAGADCPPADQRGLARPFGPACDIGAVESGSNTVASVDDTGGGGGGGGSGSGAGGGGSGLGTPNPAPPRAPVVCGGFGTIVPPCLGQIPQPRPVVTCGPSFGTILRSCEGLGLRFGGRPIGLNDPIPVEVGCGPAPGRARAAQGKGVTRCLVSLGIRPTGGLLGSINSTLGLGPEVNRMVAGILGDLDRMRTVNAQIAELAGQLSQGLLTPNAQFAAAVEDVEQAGTRIDDLEAELTRLAVAPPGRTTALVASAQRRGRGLFGSLGTVTNGLAGNLADGILRDIGLGRSLNELFQQSGLLTRGLTDTLLRDLGPAVRDDDAPADRDRRRGARAAQAGRRALARRLASRLLVASADVELAYGTRRTVRLRIAPWARPLMRRARGRSLPLRFSATIGQNGSVRKTARTLEVRVRGRRR